MKYLLSIFLVMCLTGCAVGPVEIKPAATYNLVSDNVSHDAKGATNSDDLFDPDAKRKTLLLTEMSANPGYQTSGMIYTEENQPSKLHKYSQSVWIAPPAQMIVPQLALSIAKRKIFKAVVMPPYVGSSDFILSTRLLYLKQVVSAGNTTSNLHCAIKATLLNAATHTVIDENVYADHVAANADARSGVRAAHECINNLVNKIDGMVSVDS